MMLVRPQGLFGNYEIWDYFARLFRSRRSSVNVGETE